MVPNLITQNAAFVSPKSLWVAVMHKFVQQEIAFSFKVLEHQDNTQHQKHDGVVEDRLVLISVSKQDAKAVTAIFSQGMPLTLLGSETLNGLKSQFIRQIVVMDPKDYEQQIIQLMKPKTRSKADNRAIEIERVLLGHSPDANDAFEHRPNFIPSRSM
jgi:hypothetical protein